MLSSYQSLYNLLATTDLAPWIDPLRTTIQSAFDDTKHGHLPKWRAALQQLPQVAPSSIDLNAAAVRFGLPEDLDPSQQAELTKTLHAFRPWRKGPFQFFSTFVDTEWRSNLKWDRIRQAIAPLQNRLVLDIGCGNGYYCWRMAAEGARLALGIDPFLLYNVQYLVARKYAPDTPAFVAPLAMEALPTALPVFDTVFSMGVLYHRTDPVQHLRELQRYLRPGGELVLETLVIDGPAGHALCPPGRYAKMKNVPCIPSVDTLAQWLAESGYARIRHADTTRTTSEEQRSTDWMRFESLADFLDPNDPNQTIEGHPAPQRAVFLAEAP